MKSSPFAGRYLFHLHTRFTDGTFSVRDYFEYAKQRAVGRLIFLEHIRERPSYDVEEFVAQVQECEDEYSLSAYIGFEAKLLPDGSLDVSDEHLVHAQVIGIAEHGFPDDPKVLQEAFTKVINEHPSFAENAVVWVHPGLWFKKRGVSPWEEPSFRLMIEQAQNSGVFIERNLRYDLIPEGMVSEVDPEKLVIGADVHSRKDIEAWERAFVPLTST